MLPAAFINPGDVTLMTVPGYPVAGTHTQVLRRRGLPAAAAGRERLPARPGFDSRRHPPPGEAAGAQLPEQPHRQGGHAGVLRARWSSSPRQNEIVVVQDAAHIMLTYDGQPLSFLQVPGAKDVGVEVHSLSKGWNMIGWRIGWVCGHERLVQAFADVKDNCDSGQFIAIQKAAAAALDDAEIPQRIRDEVPPPAGRSWSTCSAAAGSTARCRAGPTSSTRPAPRASTAGPTFDTAEAASQYLITEQSICTVPWDDAGAFLRFSVTYEAADEAAEDDLMAETEERLKQIQFEF